MAITGLPIGPILCLPDSRKIWFEPRSSYSTAHRRGSPAIHPTTRLGRAPRLGPDVPSPLVPERPISRRCYRRPRTCVMGRATTRSRRPEETMGKSQGTRLVTAITHHVHRCESKHPYRIPKPRLTNRLIPTGSRASDNSPETARWQVRLSGSARSLPRQQVTSRS